MKLLVLASTLDLKYRLGCTPAWWQLLKGFHEEGVEVVAIPYLGDPVESPWWRTYPNPCSTESKLANRATRVRNDRVSGKAGLSKRVSRFLIERRVRPRWSDHLRRVMEQEKDVSHVLLLNIPVNHFTGIAAMLRAEYGVKVAYYDGDMPTILPQYALERGFRFSYYEGASLDEYDVVFSNSKGVLKDLEALGARRALPLYYGADPDLFQPLDVPQDVDVAFYGYGDQLRERWLDHMVAIPSREMPDATFAVGGGGFRMDLGRVQMAGDVPYSAFGRFVGRSRINLNVTRSSHTSVYASATARPFELAAYGACIVSQPYEGIQEWFEPGRELVVVQSAKEAVETYRSLLADDDARRRMGERAREAILKRHTYRHRAKEVLAALGK